MILRKKAALGDERWFPRPNDIIAYNLLEALRGDSCPVCMLTHRSEDRFLFSLFWENVNSPHIRHRLRQSLGFCEYHSRVVWLTVRQPWAGALGVTILYRDFVNTVLGRLRDPSPLRARLFTKQADRVRRLMRPTHRCWLCELSEETEGTYLDALVEGMDTSPALRHQYSESPSLCIPHSERTIHASRTADARNAMVAGAHSRGLALSASVISIDDLGRFLLGYRSILESTSMSHRMEPACPGCAAEVAAEQSALQEITPDDLTTTWPQLCSRHRSQATLGTLGRLAVRECFVQGIVERALSDADESEMGYECPVCYRAGQAAKEAISAAGPQLGRTGCLPHIRLALQDARTEQAQAYTGSLMPRLDSLSRDMSELIRKYDYRFSHEPWGDEKDSWMRGLIFFGSERAAP